MTRRDMLQEAPDKQDEIEHTLDDYERELLQAIEAGELAPTPGPIRPARATRKNEPRAYTNHDLDRGGSSQLDAPLAPTRLAYPPSLLRD